MKLFLAHAKEDEKVTESIYEKLKNNDYTPWMDIRDIPAGVNWDNEIQKNFNSANIIIIILSKVSCQKNGYIRREMNEAMDKLKYYKPDDVFVIPILIDNSPVPTFISSKIQYIDYNREDSWELLEKSLALAATQQNFEISRGVTYGDFTFISKTFKEEYNNIPGHEIDITYPVITNQIHPQSATIISNYLAGRAMKFVFSNRTSPWPSDFDCSDEYKSTYTSDYIEGYYIAYCNNNIISILHSVSRYGAGAAHPNSYFDVSNFVVTNGDYAYEFSLHDIFLDYRGQEAINKIKEKLISEAPRTFWERTGEKPSKSDLDTLSNGIIDSNLNIFTIGESGLTFHFAPYEIHCYALGSWELFISFYDIIDYLKPDGIYSLIKVT
ncbi:TPA: TIR domain-containing protein [Yersinia enterocolitica]|uniref:TIR domain-containing protein n=1 Tax=Yersinia pseudotuberculosis TaxID=633 RepID=Q6EVT5_YERPU|nr:TIR domain-containing protein [Yersinia pseudotuberculosis]HDL6614980.1 TIR domain-containing protein [Yersinia enterocolitica]AYW90835.1 TIR domain-containing protein [Yersinia pseudotuberculosis]MBO1632104.1 TIR domain-containing protein [Yersinia pseudotuberculosis]MBP0071774.1 TIR domain-containing protein [Yersinia pseudotuberculosis]CAF28518.1 hypothetical protein [Yersinia pseudotuberculosis]